MARGSGKPAERQPEVSNRRNHATQSFDREFIRYELDKSQQADCKAWVVSADDILSTLDKLIDDGYKISVKFDDYNECYGCFMQLSTGEGTNHGYILTSRGSTAAKALKQLFYKHYQALDGDWTSAAERQGRGVLDD